MSRFLALILGCSLLPIVASVARSQDDTGLWMYGSGVHSYYAGQYKDALKSFQLADDAGLKDPRCFYFRGLALLKLGKAAAAEAEFKRGAALEATNPALLPIVSGALQRVQGRVRVTIESLRAEARSHAVAARKSQKQALYGNRQADVHDPISGQRPPPSADDPQLFGPDAVDTLVDDPAVDESSDLFPDDPVAETTTAPVDNEADDNEADDNEPDDDGGLFGDDPPADDVAQAKPADDEMPADEAKPVGGDKPRVGLGALRGILGRALGSIFPDDQETPASEDDNPFADDAPADDKPAADEPADDGDDLFGDDSADDEGDDLFGDE